MIIKTLRKTKHGYLHWCQGCGCAHEFQVDRPEFPSWAFDGNLKEPTFTPSMRIFHRAKTFDDGETIPEKTLCHYFLTNGLIRYLSDCDHGFSGQTLPLIDIPDDYAGGEPIEI